MEQLFDTLKVGSKVQSREDKYHEWQTITVTEIDGDDIVFAGEYGDVTSDRDEVNEGEYFRSAN